MAPAHIYVNLRYDIICPLGVFQNASRDNICSRPLQHLAVNIYNQHGLYPLHGYKNILDRLRDLEHLSLYWLEGRYEEKILPHYATRVDPKAQTLDPDFNRRAHLLVEFRDYGELESRDDFSSEGLKRRQVFKVQSQNRHGC